MAADTTLDRTPGAAPVLRAPGAVLLISTYELGHQPLSLASPAALLERAGFAPALLDLAVERLDPERVAAARLIGIAVPMHTALRLAMTAVDRIRRLNPSCILCLYGLYATLNAEALFARGVDCVIGGEHEEPLLRLVEALDRGAAVTVPGVATRARPAAPWIERIAFGVPSRSGLPSLDRYARLEGEGGARLAGQTETSRGCLHRCRHCPIPPVYGGRFFVVPADIVLEDIRRQVAAGATHVTFGDADFLNGPRHALGIVRRMHDGFPALTFDVTAKIEHLLRHRALLPEMRRCGCLFIVSAVESLSDRVLAILDKGHTRADVEAALDLTAAAGISLRPSLVPFTPWTGLGDYLDLLTFVADLDLIDRLDPVQLVIRLLVPPGSLLLDHPEMRPYLGPLDPDRFTYAWTHPDPRMDALQRQLSAVVESGALEGRNPRDTFRLVAARAARAAASDRGRALMAAIERTPPLLHDKGRPPRLTEPWFC
jgi:radical SAM superfamily enzyme YgiQ (UPF0313 family)